jgi:hypothetical protein
VIGDPREKRERARPTEIVHLDVTETKQEKKDETPTRPIYDVETEALALCLRYVRGEDVLDRLYEVLEERSFCKN